LLYKHNKIRLYINTQSTNRFKTSSILFYNNIEAKIKNSFRMYKIGYMLKYNKN